MATKCLFGRRDTADDRITGHLYYESSTYIKDGSILTAKIAAGAVTANEIAANTITAAKIAAGTITGDKIAAGAITAEKIAAGSITAAQISAGAIKATQLTLGDLSNLAVDPNGDLGVCIFDNANVVSVGGGNYAYQCLAGARDSMSSNWFAVQPGDQFYFFADMNWVSGAQTTSALGFCGKTSTGTVVGWYGVVATSDYSAGWKRLTGAITIPATVERVYIWWQRNGFDVSTCGIWNMRNVVIKKKISGGDLIVAGTITGDKIAANQTITAPNISGGTLNLGGGKFTVDAAGNFNAIGSGLIGGNVSIDGMLSVKSVVDVVGRVKWAVLPSKTGALPANIPAGNTLVKKILGVSSSGEAMVDEINLSSNASYRVSDIELVFPCHQQELYTTGFNYVVAYLKLGNTIVKAWWVARSSVSLSSAASFEGVVLPAGSLTLPSYVSSRFAAKVISFGAGTPKVELGVGLTNAPPTMLTSMYSPVYDITLPSFVVPINCGLPSGAYLEDWHLWRIGAAVSFTLTKTAGTRSVFTNVIDDSLFLA